MLDLMIQAAAAVQSRRDAEELDQASYEGQADQFEVRDAYREAYLKAAELHKMTDQLLRSMRESLHSADREMVA